MSIFYLYAFLFYFSNVDKLTCTSSSNGFPSSYTTSFKKHGNNKHIRIPSFINFEVPSFHRNNGLPYSPPKRSTALKGIPKFFGWLTAVFPQIKADLHNLRRIDNFYVDMNGIIHLCTHGNQPSTDVMADESQMYQRIFRYLERLYQTVKPQRVMLLAVDGVAPNAKLHQQRNRRYRSAKLEGMSHTLFDNEEQTFDPNCITPGTDFMYRLNLALRKWITYKLKTDSSWMNGCTVILSGSDVPGEGEHKIMEYIRTNTKKDASFEGYSHCLYGLDADLILLSLVTHKPSFIVLREKMSWLFRRNARNHHGKRQSNAVHPPTAALELLDITLLRKHLIDRFEAFKDRDIDRIIDDFILLSLFVGNDFLPSLPHMDISEGGMQLLFDKYQMMLNECGGYLTDKAKIHTRRLEMFLQNISSTEESYFKKRGKQEEELPYLTSEYKHHYYQQKFGWSREKEEEIRTVVTHYVEGLYWVLHYYHHGCPSWDWHFPFHYAPLSTDLHNLPMINVTLKQGKPVAPLTQLLSVVPPQGYKLLPQAYRNLVREQDSPLVDLYPIDFVLDPDGKTAQWEHKAIIPFMNASRLAYAIEDIHNTTTLEMKERLRNLHGRPHTMLPQYKEAPPSMRPNRIWRKRTELVKRKPIKPGS